MTAELPATVRDRLGPALDEVAAGAVKREIERALPYDAIRLLAEHGVGMLRVPVALGGAGLSLRELMQTVTAVAWADSNVAQALRGHFAYIEIVLLRPSSPERDMWLRRFADGAVVGSAASENTTPTVGDISTTLTEDDGVLRLNGRKFYSTGTLYADWIHVSAVMGDRRVMLLADATARGVTRVDDWDGFGQRLTGSGTTLFKDVVVDPGTVVEYGSTGPDHLQAFYQLVHLATLAGVLRRAFDDMVAYVRGRKRSFLQGNAALPRDDAQVLQVVGEMSAATFTADAVVAAAADRLDAVLAADDEAARMQGLDEAEIAIYRGQVELTRLATDVTSRIFEVGGGSQVGGAAALDRHWRNARTLLSHNPTIYKARMVGEYEISGRGPGEIWARLANPTNS